MCGEKKWLKAKLKLKEEADKIDKKLTIERGRQDNK